MYITSTTKSPNVCFQHCSLLIRKDEQVWLIYLGTLAYCIVAYNTFRVQLWTPHHITSRINSEPTNNTQLPIWQPVSSAKSSRVSYSSPSLPGGRRLTRPINRRYSGVQTVREWQSPRLLGHTTTEQRPRRTQSPYPPSLSNYSTY